MIHPRFRLFLPLLLLLSLTIITAGAWAQSTVASGSIQGTVTDPNGAVVPNASVTITNKDTGQTSKLTTSSSGAYASGALQPGNYQVRIEAKGFQTQLLNVPVQVGVTASGNAKMSVGQTTTEV
ncbi:MAG TPA: carboxypeptidase-like regulatory domain-containing protein, partial [Candidatus Angelobacter sp.]|nr:carboxypeptidase-like regulatory domain-containing protein [Candidatus Angelobacter sp.]